MKKLILIIMFFHCFGCSKNSLDWKTYHQDGYQTILIENNSIKVKGNYVSFWYVSKIKDYPQTFWLWKEVFDCKNYKVMTLYYEVTKSLDKLPSDVPDLTDEDRWLNITKNGWDADVFRVLCESTIKNIYF